MRFSITPSFTVLFRHFFAVAFYSIWVMFTHPHPVMGPDEKITYIVPGWDAYPYLFLKSLQVVRTSFARPMSSILIFGSALVVLGRLHRVRPAHVGRDPMVVSVLHGQCV